MAPTMLALIFDGSLRLASVPTPARGDGDALVRVRMAGICSTDLEILRGYKRFHGVLGHEFVGEVVECDDEGWVGRRVCGEITITCGTCSRCRDGLREHCAQRTVLGILDRAGAFAEYVTVPVRNLHAVPQELSDEQAVFVEPLAAAFEILEQVEVRGDYQVVVLGDGRLGLLCAQVLRLAGAQVTVVGKHPEKLALVSRLGLKACHVESPLPCDVDMTVEATGSATGLQTAVALTRPRGTVVLKSTVADTSATDLSPIVVNELSVVGSRCGPFPRALQALTEDAIQVLPLIETTFPLARGLEAMNRAAEPGVLKVLLAMDGA